ncbi:exosortase family protein XrtF [Epilithonimonas hungarica]|uniref:Exosortase family protein XrtF n=1 Tax=Epilithonimonas hungarica TaxID=454006 RepID=A0A1G7PMG1_9FLAO|nr:exosortase family protein XrtF [Epilithonimonas hungarica]SDF87406.1 exosortase family protein XrtF [Epilithonimonas hungarica]
MKDFLPVLKILLRFVVIYIVLVLLYQFYLNGYEKEVVDPFTRWVAKQVAFLQDLLGFPTILVDNMKLHSVLFRTSGKFTTRMVEGCNVFSVAILFAAFIFAFYKGKKTFLYVAGGLVILHILNVFRIALLNIIYLKYPQYEKIGHDYIFPAIIYGGVVILWLVWIQFFALKKTGRP